jgi:16S rRNA (guanine527-N7)-methyltransferase
VLKEQLKTINLEFDKLFYEKCDMFVSLLQEWGAVHNFTSSKALSTQEINLNIIDSIYPLTFLNHFNSFADIGTGAGYPGLLLSIAKPNIKATLIEPKGKKVAFLNFVKSALSLDNVEILHKKVQDIPPQSFELITSRAVTNISLLLSMTQHITFNETEFLFYKGSLCQDEMKEIKLNKYDIIKSGKYRNYLYIKRKGLFE